MARNLNPSRNPYINTNNRLVSSWLHEIPSDAGGGSEATLIAPSVSELEESSPRRVKDEVLPLLAQFRRDNAPPAPPPQLSPRRAKDEVLPPLAQFRRDKAPPAPPPQLSPRRQPVVNPNPNPNSSPTRSTHQKPGNPNLPRPANTSPVRLQLRPNPTPSSPPAAPGPEPTPQPPPLPIRDRITANFTSLCLHCTTTNPPSPAESCPRCPLAHAYVHRPHHAPAFLTSHLLPISEVLSFDEAVAYLNEAIAARLAGVLDRGGRGDRERGTGRPFPTLDDFDVVRGVAGVRKRVVEMGGWLVEEGGVGRDRFGILRGRR